MREEPAEEEKQESEPFLAYASVISFKLWVGTLLPSDVPENIGLAVLVLFPLSREEEHGDINPRSRATQSS